MHVTGGSFLSIIKRTTAPSRIGSSLHSDHFADPAQLARSSQRRVIMVVPVLVITLMYFMFENAPHRRQPDAVQQCC